MIVRIIAQSGQQNYRISHDNCNTGSVSSCSITSVIPWREASEQEISAASCGRKTLLGSPAAGLLPRRFARKHVQMIFFLI
jgi:hypothetical protein